MPQRKGDPVMFTRDEGIRPQSTAESLAKLPVLMNDGVVAAGNAAQQNDAAAGCLIVAEDQLHQLDLKPMAFLVGWPAVGGDPSRMGIGPVPAPAKVLAKTGLALDAIGLVEINEAFAAQVLAVLKGLDWHDQARLNGSGVSLGHPIGATGVRIMTTLLHEMERQQVRSGL